MQSLLLTAIDRLRAPAPPAGRVEWIREWTFAHRGLHSSGVPENSASAFADAMAAGLGIECDVQRTGDGRAAVFHDWELDRLTDRSGQLSKMAIEDIECIALSENGDMIPRLERMLDQVSGQVPVLIELKSRGDTRMRSLCLAVRRALEGYPGHHAVMSFDANVPRWFATHSPRTPRGLVMTEKGAKEDGTAHKSAWARHKALWQAKPDFLAYDIRNLPSRFAAAQRRRGLPVLTWTVGTPELRTTANRHADAAIAEKEGFSAA